MSVDETGAATSQAAKGAGGPSVGAGPEAQGDALGEPRRGARRRPVAASAPPSSAARDGQDRHELEQVVRERTEELSKSREFLDAIMQAQPLSLVVLDAVRDDAGSIADFRVSYANEAAQRLSAECVGEGATFTAIFPGAAASGVLDGLRRVTESGEPLDAEFDCAGEGLRGRFRLLAVRLGDGLVVTIEDVTARRAAEAELDEARRLLERRATAFERKRAEDAIRRSEERHSFLVRLEDALRPLGRPEDVQLTACRLLGEYTGAGRVGIAEDVGDDTVTVACTYCDGVPDLRGTYTYDDYGPELLREMAKGRTVVRPDIAGDPTLTDEAKERHAALGLGATVNVPLIRDGRLVAAFFMHHREAHPWTSDEVELLETVAARIWGAVQRTRAEAALRESERQHRLLFESTEHGVVYQAADGAIVAANPSAERILGVTLDQLQGRTSMDPSWRFIREDGSPFPGEEHPASIAMRTGKRVPDVVFGVFNPVLREYRWITVSATPEFRRSEDKPFRVFTTFADVTELKRVEQALRESEQRMRVAQEATGLGVYDWDIAGGTLTWDARASELFDVAPDEPVTFETFMDSVHPDDLDHARAQIEQGLDPSGSHFVSLQIRIAGHQPERWIRTVGHATFDGDTAVRVVGTVEDVSDRIGAEEALRESEDRQSFILALTDTLRSMTDEQDMLRASAAALTARLGVDRVRWAVRSDDAGPRDDEEPEPVRVRRRDDACDVARRIDREQYLDGAGARPAVPAAAGRAEESAAAAFVPVYREGRVAACLFATHDAAHPWPEKERRLLRDVAERTWLAVERVRAEQAVQHEAARLQAVIDAVPVGFAFHDADGRLDALNEEARRIWYGTAVSAGDEPEDYRGFWPGTGRHIEPQEWPAAQAVLHGTVTKDLVVDIERFDESHGTVVVSAAPIMVEGRPAGAVVGMQDITELRRAEQVLRLLTAEVRILHEASVLDQTISPDELTRTMAVQARALLDSDGCSVYRVDEKGALRRELVVGAAPPKGRGAPKAVEQAVERAVHERLIVVERDAAGHPLGDREARTGTCLAVPLVLRDDALGALALHFRQPRLFDEHYERVARAFADQAALAIENARLRAQVAENAAEGERNRLARDLHDSVTQALFAASLKAEALARVGDEVSPKTLEIIEQVQRLTRGALAQMRTMLLEMRGEPLSDVPLPELLRHLAEATESRAHVNVNLTVRGRAELPPEVHEALYRIAQEALNNVSRHAKATNAWVLLDLTAEAAHLVIGDDGSGFDPAVRRASHLGMRTMQERARTAGADLKLITRLDSGTVVTVDWPGGDRS